MSRLESYIAKNFSEIFFSIFLPLFAIASLIFFIKIVSITSTVKVTFLELLQLYLFILPQIIFYTIPIAFFVGGAISLAKLSYDYELIVLFSLGIKPAKIAAIFLKIALFASVVLLVVSLGLIPKTKQLYKNFVAFKKSQATLNIKPTEYGQKFGNWYLFIEQPSGKPNSFERVVLFNKEGVGTENFIMAKEAMLDTNASQLRFILKEGSGYTYEKTKLSQMDFKNMIINDPTNLQNEKYLSVLEYWLEALHNKTRSFDLTVFVLASLFPILCIPLMLSIGILNPRYQKNYSYLFVFLGVVLYYVLIYSISKTLMFYAPAVIIPMWLAISYIIYQKTIKKRY